MAALEGLGFFEVGFGAAGASFLGEHGVRIDELRQIFLARLFDQAFFVLVAREEVGAVFGVMPGQVPGALEEPLFDGHGVA